MHKLAHFPATVDTDRQVGWFAENQLTQQRKNRIGFIIVLCFERLNLIYNYCKPCLHQSKSHFSNFIFSLAFFLWISVKRG
jgi:hypothetical protein